MCDECAPQLQETVAEAAKRLDKVVPGWEDRVDLPTLNIASCSDCILGQVFRKEARAWNRRLNLTGYHYAMDKHWDGIMSGLSIAFTQEDAERYWVQEIQSRRLAAKIPLKSDHALTA